MRGLTVALLLLTACGSGDQWLDGRWTITGSDDGWLDLYESDGGVVGGTYNWGIFAGSVTGFVRDVTLPQGDAQQFVGLELEDRLVGANFLISVRPSDDQRRLFGATTAGGAEPSKPRPPPLTDAGWEFTFPGVETSYAFEATKT